MRRPNIPFTCATSLLALAITSCGAFAPYTTDDPKFREWAASAIDTAANKAGQSVADALHIEDGATVAVITESIKNATGEAAETLRAALEKDGEARRAALYDWAQKFMALLGRRSQALRVVRPATLC